MPRDISAHVRYQWYRHGWPAVAGLVLIGFAAGLQLLGVEPLRARADALGAAQTVLRQQRVKAPSQDEVKRGQLTAFYARLPAAADALEAIADIHGAAQVNGVTLAHGEYRLARDGGAPLMRYQITLPARSTYPRLRAWLADTLDAVPNVSLDEISLKRDDAGSDSVDARVRLTLYLRAD